MLDDRARPGSTIIVNEDHTAAAGASPYHALEKRSLSVVPENFTGQCISSP